MQIMLQHVSIPGSREESAAKARRFYSELIGLTVKPVPDSITHLILSGSRLARDRTACICEMFHRTNQDGIFASMWAM